MFLFFTRGDASTRLHSEIWKARRGIPDFQHALIEIRIAVALATAKRGAIATRGGQNHAVGTFKRRQHEA